MTEIPMKRYWMGQDIDEFPREKLIEIIDHLAWELETTRAAARSIIEIGELGRRARSHL